MKMCSIHNVEHEEEAFSSSELKRKSSRCRVGISEKDKTRLERGKQLIDLPKKCGGPCGEVKPGIEFSNCERERPNGKCKECSHIYGRAYYQENSEKLKAHAKQYAINNPEKVATKQREYYQENKEELQAANRARRQKPENKKRRSKQDRERRKNDLVFQLRGAISSAIAKDLKQSSGSKNGNSILNFLPYTFEELQDHLEKLFSHPSNLTPDGQIWMTWENRGVYYPKTWNDSDPKTWVWQLDHIIPQALLPYSSMEDENFKICWALSNLRPLSAKQNVIDGANRIRHQTKVG